MTEESHYTVIGRKFNWTPLYGTLESGEYQFILSADSMFNINIAFTIQPDGTVSFEKPELM